MRYNGERTSLGDIAVIRTGKLNSNAAVEGGKYPFFTCAPNPLRIDCYAYDQKAIILAGNNAEGNFHISYYEGKFNAYQRTYVIDAENESRVDLRYLYYALKLCLADFKALSQGTSTKFLTAKILNKFAISLPDIDIQKRIAKVLTLIDDKINLNNKINDNLQQQAQSIYHERFEGVLSDDLPSNWRIVTLGEVATISNKSFNPLKEPERMLEHYSIPAFDEARFPVFESSTSIKSNKFIVDASCFMISKLNPTTKRVWKPYCITENAVCSTEFIVYRAKDQSITDFLYSVIDSGSFTDFMCSHVTGSTGSRQRTTPSDTLSYEFVLPSDDELEEFQSIVSPMYAQMRINAIENDRLKWLRDSLLPRLMSGEIDVSAIWL